MNDEDSKTRPRKQLPRDDALDELDVLVGEWETEATHPKLPDAVHGRATFEWLRGRRFLIWRTSAPAGAIPSAISVIGGGDVAGTWPMHYFDERGVMRVYQVKMSGGVWRIWRDHPGFSQRMTGTLEHGGRTLRLAWELQEDGPFTPDLQAIYRRRDGGHALI